MDIIIRKMTANDLERVHYLLVEQLGWDILMEDLTRRFELYCDTDVEKIEVAELDNKVIGFIHYAETSFLVEEPFIEVRTLVVDADNRRQGIGASLMSKAEGWAKSQGFQKVALYSGMARELAHKFYEKIGYEKNHSFQFLIKKFNN